MSTSHALKGLWLICLEVILSQGLCVQADRTVEWELPERKPCVLFTLSDEFQIWTTILAHELSAHFFIICKLTCWGHTINSPIYMRLFFFFIVFTLAAH